MNEDAGFNGRNLVDLRKHLGLSQNDFVLRLSQYTGGKVRITPESIRNYENGRSEPAGRIMHALIHLAQDSDRPELSRKFYSL